MCIRDRIALQPERGHLMARDADYHDLSRTPRHGYVAFYLWLRAQGLHALIHMGAHGTLEWLPGKSVALSGTCWPEALTGAMPVTVSYTHLDVYKRQDQYPSPAPADRPDRPVSILTLE